MIEAVDAGVLAAGLATGGGLVARAISGAISKLTASDAWPALMVAALTEVRSSLSGLGLELREVNARLERLERIHAETLTVPLSRANFNASPPSSHPSADATAQQG